MSDCVIFAAEGVLIDSERIAAEARAASLVAAGVDISADELIEDFGGLAFKDILLRLERRANVPLQATLIGEADTRADKRLAQELQPVEGAREALGRASRRCVVSDAPAERVEAWLAATGLKPFVPRSVFSSASLGLKGKPAPDLLLHAAEAMKADADECFVIGCAVPDIEAAKAAGMRVVGFTGGAQAYPGLADRLTDAGAETVIRRLADLRVTLAALADWSPAD